MNDTPRRSDATKAAILAAARGRFASDGYERATIRAIAADAAIDPAMVMRYFGSKEKLFVAAAEIDLRIPDVSAVPRRALGETLVRHFVDRWEGDGTLNALLRSAATNEAAADRARSIFGEQIVTVAESLDPDRRLAVRRAGLVASQILGMALCRYVLRFPPLAAMSKDEVIAWLAPTVQRYLTAKPPQRSGAGKPVRRRR
ncbi:MAG: TetR family transcriptional regulator [Streptosporangiales bacterium]|nr:TetR family transcriptional regulator [Streptosporangiales bacterium]MBO0889643.1 TetR family transcriptional regulator [Acidothermales bacterium]